MKRKTREKLKYIIAGFLAITFIITLLPALL